MRTRYWKFAYNEDDLPRILNSTELPFPDLSRWPNAKNSSEERVIDDLSVGDVILLANFDQSQELGIAKAFGLIESKEDGLVSIRWKRKVPSLSLSPDPQGGVKEWRNEGVFCFDVNPAKRYKLDEHSSKLF